MKKRKTRGSGTLTEAQFWAKIRSALRNTSRWWPPIQQTKIKSRRPYKGPNKRQKYEYQCNYCKKWFPEKQIQVDHIVCAGSLKNGKDLEGFVDRLFCEENGLQCLCSFCHGNKSKEDKLKMKSRE